MTRRCRAAKRRLIGQALGVAVLLYTGASQADDGKRGVEAPRFGIKVRVPQAWDLVDWNRGDRAFELDLPQDAGSLVGHVRCTLGPATESLEQQERRYAAQKDVPPSEKTPGRTLLGQRIEPLDELGLPVGLADRFGRRLVVDWVFADAQGRRWFERRIHVADADVAYTFTLDSDESHFDAYAVDFEEMFAAAAIEPLKPPLTLLPGGFWLQPQFRFALKLPAGWRPSFGPSERVLLFAVGATHGEHFDQLSVQAAPLPTRNLEQLRTEIPAEVKRVDSAAAVVCKLVSQGHGTALETIIRTTRSGIPVVVLERRFATNLRNYEVKLTCEAAEFARRETEFRAVLDTFAEVPQPQANET